MDTMIIGIAGGTGSGKTTLTEHLKDNFGRHVSVVYHDNYYKAHPNMPYEERCRLNYDHPDAFDMELLEEHLAMLKRYESIEMPLYDFVHHRRRDESVTVQPRPLVIIEGLMVLHSPKIRELLDLKLYVDTPDDIRFIRRLKRDIAERGRTVESVCNQYLEVVRPGHFNFIEPTKIYADLIIPEGGYNENALSVLIPFVKELSG